MAVRTRPTRSRRLTGGFSITEVVVGSLIVAVAIFGFIGCCLMMYTMTNNQRNLTVALSLARLNIERTKLDGFANAQEGLTSFWYDAYGQNESSTVFASAAFEVDRTVTSSKTQTVGSQTLPTDDALRTVVITVESYPDGKVYQTWGTLLSKGGA